MLGGEELIDLYDEPRERMKPVEPRVVEDESEKRAAALDAPLFALVSDACVVEQRLVDAEQPAAHVLEALAERWGKRVGGAWLRVGHGRSVRRESGIASEHGNRSASAAPGTTVATGSLALPSAGAISESSLVTDPRHLPGRPIEQVRERVIEALSEHFARDHLTMEELESRMTRVYAASTPQEVNALLDGLPALTASPPLPATADDHAIAPKLRDSLIAVMSGVVRRGLWKIPRRLRAVAVMGGIELDLREAVLSPGVTEIYAFVFMGGLVVRVPPGVRLETDGFAFMGGFEDRIYEPGAAARDAPVVRVTGVAIMGGVDAQVLAPGVQV